MPRGNFRSSEPGESPQTFGPYLKRLMDKYWVSPDKLAMELGFERSSVFAWQRNNIPFNMEDHIPRIIQILGRTTRVERVRLKAACRYTVLLKVMEKYGITKDELRWLDDGPTPFDFGTKRTSSYIPNEPVKADPVAMEDMLRRVFDSPSDMLRAKAQYLPQIQREYREIMAEWNTSPWDAE